MKVVLFIITIVGSKMDIEYIPMPDLRTCERLAEKSTDMIQDIMNGYVTVVADCVDIWEKN